MRYEEQLALLHKGITRGEKDPVLPLIKDTREALNAETRLNVYADGYSERLAEITLGDYPATQHFMGEQRAQGAAKAYALETIPTQWDANRYSLGFAGFLAREVPEEKALIALATLEAAIAKCFWSEETAPLTAEALQEESLPTQILTLRSASQLIDLSHDAEAYLQAFRAENAADNIYDKSIYIMVLRHNNQVMRHVLEAAEFSLLKLLSEGLPFGEALENHPDQATLAERLPHYLSRWLNEGFFSK